MEFRGKEYLENIFESLEDSIDEYDKYLIEKVNYRKYSIGKAVHEYPFFLEMNRIAIGRWCEEKDVGGDDSYEYFYDSDDVLLGVKRYKELSVEWMFIRNDKCPIEIVQYEVVSKNSECSIEKYALVNGESIWHPLSIESYTDVAYVCLQYRYEESRLYEVFSDNLNLYAHKRNSRKYQFYYHGDKLVCIEKLSLSGEVLDSIEIGRNVDPYESDKIIQLIFDGVVKVLDRISISEDIVEACFVVDDSATNFVLPLLALRVKSEFVVSDFNINSLTYYDNEEVDYETDELSALVKKYSHDFSVDDVIRMSSEIILKFSELEGLKYRDLSWAVRLLSDF